MFGKVPTPKVPKIVGTKKTASYSRFSPNKPVPKVPGQKRNAGSKRPMPVPRQNPIGKKPSRRRMIP